MIDYYEYLRSSEWRTQAEACKRRAGYRCQICNGTQHLQAHHRTYDRLGHELPDDLTCLCDECHGLFSRHRREPCYRCGIVQTLKALFQGA